MGSDKARRSYDAERRYRSIVEQQGRVTLEADLNEAEEIRATESRAVLVEVVGPFGSPDDGFKVSVPALGSDTDFDFGFAAGTIYVGGTRVTNPETQTYFGQKSGEWADYPDGADSAAPPDTASFTEAIYLMLTEQEVSAVEDPALREVALGGPDTTARTRLVQRVHRTQTDGDTCTSAFERVVEKLGERGLTFDPNTMRLGSSMQLKVEVDAAAGQDDNCQPITKGGFLGAENQLIRVQVSRDDGFLWGYDNASFLYRATITGDSTLKLEGIPVDAQHAPTKPRWVEILGTAVLLDDKARIAAHTGLPAKVDHYDETSGVVTLTAPLPAEMRNSPPPQVFIRIWERWQPLPTDENTRTPLIKRDGTGTGVNVYMKGKAARGDFWMIGVRPSTPQMVFPERLFEFQPPDGPNRWVAPLAVVAWNDAKTAEITDCRPSFDPLSTKCCIRVRPGADIRDAIKKVKEAGGGCIELCPGVHRVVGPLRLEDAADIRLVGKGACSVLHLDPDSQGDGGLVIKGCHRISIENLLLVSIEVTALVDAVHSRTITLRGLALVNAANPHERTAITGLRLGDCHGVDVRDSRIFAAIGLVGRWGAALSETVQPQDPLADYGAGVSNLTMSDCRVAYSKLGILSTRSERWRIERCRIQSQMEPEHLYKLADGLRAPQKPAAMYAELLSALDKLDNAPNHGIAIAGHIWRDCAVRDSQLAGDQAVQVWGWIRSSICRSEISAVGRGLFAFWAHRSDWSDNQMRVNDGAAMSFVGSFLASMRNNRARAAQGCFKHALKDVALEYLALHRTILQEGYGFDEEAQESEHHLFRILLAELVDVVGLTDFIAAVDSVISQLPENVPPVLSYLATELRKSLRENAKAGTAPSWTSAGVLIPVAALTIEGNAVQSEADAILIEQFFAMSGMRVADNQLTSARAQGVRINAWPFSAPVGPNVTMLQLLLDYINEQDPAPLFPEYDMPTPEEQALYDAVRNAVNSLLDDLWVKLREWKRGLTPFLVSDYRIERNTLRCSATALESNLFDLVVDDNDIRMHSPTGAAELVEKIADTVALPDIDLGTLVREGDVAAVDYLLRSRPLEGESSGLVSLFYLDDKVLLARGFVRFGAPPQGTNPDPRYTYVAPDTLVEDATTDAAGFQEAIAAGDPVEARTHLGRLSYRLEFAMSSYGIWVKGHGCRVSGNRIGATPRRGMPSESRGGVLLQSDERLALAWLFMGILEAFLGGTFSSATLISPETAVEANQISSGLGHGVHVVEAPPFLSALTGDHDKTYNNLSFLDVTVARNHVKHMSGAGLSVNPEAQVVKLDIQGNRFEECSSTDSGASLTTSKGGIVVNGAGLCRIRENNVLRCGGAGNAAGADLSWLIYLDLHANHVVANGEVLSSIPDDTVIVGGVRLRGMFGEVRVCGNELLLNENGELHWSNTGLEAEETMKIIYALVRDYTSEPDKSAITDVNALIADNTFRSRPHQDLGSPCFALEGLHSSVITLTTNVCIGQAREPLGSLEHARSLVATGNHFRPRGGGPMRIAFVDTGVVANNVSIDAGPIELTSAAGLSHHLNIPPIP